MSGIAGWVSWQPGPQDAATLRHMLDAAAYRGPDGRGAWYDGRAALGHLALQTTPESLLERQPVVDGDLVLVSDARIDNRAELLRRLALPGNDSTPVWTDAALILAAYRRWGIQCAAALIGDFSFAIWDGSEQRLFAARDPLGMRAFFYHADARRFFFATEIKQILAAGVVPPEIYEPAIAAHLTGGEGRPEWTAYRNVVQLAPAHALVASAAGQRTWRYWDVDPERRIRYRNHGDYVEHFRELFKEAVRARLRSVRPVGLLLSGGLDSGSIASTAAWLIAHERELSVPEFRAYSWAFDELGECDERHISGPLADSCGIPVTEVPADDAWPLRAAPQAALDRDDPFIFGHYAILERAFSAARAEGMGLIMSGDRGDLVAGLAIYDFPSLFWTGRWPTLFGELRIVANRRRVPVSRVVRSQLLRPAVLAGLQNGAGVGRLPALRRWHAARAWRPPFWLSPTLARQADLLATPAAEPPPGLRGLARRERYAAVFMPMHFRGVRTSERMHARFGQAFADPWSDRRLAEFAVAVPQRVLNRAGENKRLTRAAMSGIVPEAARLSMRKIVPLPLYDRGIRDRSRCSILDLLTNGEAGRRGYVDEAVLQQEYTAVLNGGRDDGYLWFALSLELWLRAFWT